MAFTRPIVHLVDIAMPPVTRVPNRADAGTRHTRVRWLYAVAVAGLLLFLVGATVERSVAADRVRRAEVESREGHLYRQLANRDAVLESQRRIYLERIRRLEAELWGKDQAISVSRTRAAQPMQRPAASTEGCPETAVISPRG
jgi:hypothetical protein